MLVEQRTSLCLSVVNIARLQAFRLRQHTLYIVTPIKALHRNIGSSAFHPEPTIQTKLAAFSQGRPVTNMATSTSNNDSSDGPVYFWREYEEAHGFMSQWYESAFEVDGVRYETAEMWMMIQKAKLFGDEVRVLL